MDYKDAGVDIEQTDAFVETIKQLVKKTHNKNVQAPIGGFAGLYKLNDSSSLVACTDGVGTKLMLAQALDNHKTIGIDLVAMCVNDMLCVGAKPLFFLDYYATGKFNPKQSKEVLEGIVEGCVQSGIPLLGGETAEMPDMYPEGKYDLAGFSIGMVQSKDILPKNNLSEGDAIIGVASSGFHSNGYSLVRKMIKSDEKDLMQKVLTPTTIYTKYFDQIQNSFSIKGIANITGGGMWNIPRISDQFDYILDALPDYSEIPEEIEIVCKRTNASKEELYKTFNMGIGLAIIIPQSEVAEFLSESNKHFKTWKIGSVKKGSGQVIL